MKCKSCSAILLFGLLGVSEVGAAENISSAPLLPSNALKVEAMPNSNLIYFSGKENVSKRINLILFPPTPEPETTDANDVVDGPSDSSEVIRNDAKVVVVNIHSEGCAASCSSSNTHYNFDAKTGQYIHFSSLFTPAGMSKVSLKLIKSWKKQIREDAKELVSSDIWAPGCIKDGVNGCLDGLVNECFQRMETNYDEGTPYMGNDFEISLKGLIFSRESCINNHGYYDANVSYQEISEYMSEYGKSLFSRNAITDQPMHPYNKILEGAIGDKYKIKMYLLLPYPSADYIDGWYVYTKHNKPITIFGKYKDNTLTIQETDAVHNPVGPKIVAHPTKDGFIGYWEGNGKRLKFSTFVGQP